MNEITLNKMSQLKLYGMHRTMDMLLNARELDKLGNDEFIHMLVQSEWEDRENRKTIRNIKAARFRQQATVEQVDFTAGRNLDKNRFLRYADCSFIAKKENILITGPTGVGKSYLASALGHQACTKGYKVKYSNMQKLVSWLKMSHADGSYFKEIGKIEKQNLLILDDFGLQSFDQQSRMMFLEILEDRYDKQSTIISSQLPVEKWYELIGDNTIADAILNRLVNNSHRIELNGKSMRRKIIK
jgi:DNA replication protein DnaC